MSQHRYRIVRTVMINVQIQPLTTNSIIVSQTAILNLSKVSTTSTQYTTNKQINYPNDNISIHLLIITIMTKYQNTNSYPWRLSINDYQLAARQKLQKSVFGYFESGADDQITLQQNQTAFKNIKIYPRVLVDMSHLNMNTRILGRQLSIPFGVAPVAMQKLIHPSGQLLAAKQAYQQNTAYGLSMLATSRPEQIFKVNQTGLKIHQLYLLTKQNYTQQFIEMVAKNGFNALALTVDTQVFGKRRINLINNFNPQVTLEVFKQLGVQIYFDQPKTPERSFVNNINNRVTWNDIKKLKQLANRYSLKVILKGITDYRDVQLAHLSGVDAIWVSNHGGRQLDTCPATIEALPSIRNQVTRLKSKMEVYVDGGVRRGADIFKCLALGADFVFIGRGFLYSLIDGEEGIKKAFEILKTELKTTMMLAGTRNIPEITKEYILSNEPYSRL